MSEKRQQDTWRLAKHGPRPSTLLAAGAIAGAIGPLLLWRGYGDQAWVAWLASLLLIAGGLLLSGIRPWLTTFALIPGGLYLLQGASLALAIGGIALGAHAHSLLALPKLLSLVLLAVLAVRQIDRRRRRWLAVVAGLASLKPLLRHVGALEGAWSPVLDSLLAVLLAWALVQVAVVLRRLETAWATRRWQESHARLDDFDAPPLPPVR